MKNTIFKLLLIWIFLYLLAYFSNLEIDFTKWDSIDRENFSASIFIITLCYFLFVELTKSNK